MIDYLDVSRWPVERRRFMLKWLALVAGLALPLVAVETGTHWAAPGDFVQLRNLGYQYAVVALGNNEPEWKTVFDSADMAGIRLIAGIYPPPYTLANGSWTISSTGQKFLRYAASRSTTVKAIFGFNEPYWTNPFTGTTSYCGNLSASDLRALRVSIRQIWSEAKVYHDLGNPSAWAPGGELRKSYACIGDKYADQTGVADFVGIWAYPFDKNGQYSRAASLSLLTSETAYARNQMKAEPVLLGQSFLCTNCGEATRFPTVAELQDWNCALRTLKPESISWYVWQQSLYADFLSQHPTHWNATSPSACPSTSSPKLTASIAGPSLVENLSAPGALLSLYGSDFSLQTAAMVGYPLPRTLGETIVLINGIAAPLYYVSPRQINVQVPWESGTGDFYLQVQRGGEASNALRLRVESVYPSLFTFVYKSLELAAALNGLTNAVITTDNPAAANGIVSLYASGLGSLSGTNPQSGQPFVGAAQVGVTVAVKVGGVAAKVMYAGAAPGFAGVYQVNAQLPADLTPGNYAVWIEMSGRASNGGILAVR